MLPDPWSRSSFIWCWAGREFNRDCEPGFEFNPFERVCTSSHGLLGGNPCFGRPDNVRNSANLVRMTSFLDNVLFQTFVPNPNNRNGFFWCNRGQAQAGQCDPGFEFHPIDLVCDRSTNPPVQWDPCFGQPDNV